MHWIFQWVIVCLCTIVSVGALSSIHPSAPLVLIPFGLPAVVALFTSVTARPSSVVEPHEIDDGLRRDPSLTRLFAAAEEFEELGYVPIGLVEDRWFCFMRVRYILLGPWGDSWAEVWSIAVSDADKPDFLMSEFDTITISELLIASLTTDQRVLITSRQRQAAARRLRPEVDMLGVGSRATPWALDEIHDMRLADLLPSAAPQLLPGDAASAREFVWRTTERAFAIAAARGFYHQGLNEYRIPWHGVYSAVWRELRLRSREREHVRRELDRLSGAFEGA